MFHEAIELKFLRGTRLKVTFSDGSIHEYDMASMFDKYPQFKALTDRQLFISGKLYRYGIVWNDELDIETETIYEDGKEIGVKKDVYHGASAHAVMEARCNANITQKQLAELTGIDQSDISKIERGVANPSVSTLERIAEAVGGKLKISIEM
ncbi:MAG: helix-turn-helix domain-containing protein [Spirochaetales bacterium]|nr:helix-turn-helix domain-containing protein [Spirochaetales bacterium]